MEIWRDYDENYQVSNIGRVRNKITGNIKKTTLHNGYFYINHDLKGKHSMKSVHRMVAQTFIPNPDNLREVDHINCNKQDNRVENLQWVSSNENKLRAIDKGIWESNRRKWFGERKPVIAVDLKSGEKERFISLNQAENKYGRHIIDVIKGRRTKTHNHYFYYEGGDATR